MSKIGIINKRNIRTRKRIGKIPVVVLLLACLASLLVPISLAAAPGEVTLTVKQVFINAGTAEPPNKTFSYRLTPEQPTNPLPSGSIAGIYDFDITGTADKPVTITFTNAGVYTYELSHTTAPADGYTYNQKIYTLIITVNSDLTYTIVIRNEAGNKVDDEDIQYKHSYNDGSGPEDGKGEDSDNDKDKWIDPSDPNAMKDPSVVKTVSGSPGTAGTFTFQLTAQNPSNPMPSGSVHGVKTVQVKGSGKAQFGTWSYTQEGIYFYTISEVIPSAADGYAYDTTVYTITDSVTAVNGRLVVSRVVTNNQNKPVTSCSFINTYTDSGKPGSPATPHPDAPNGPKTGDDSRTEMYSILLCTAGIAALLSLCYLVSDRRRRDERDEYDT